MYLSFNAARYFYANKLNKPEEKKGSGDIKITGRQGRISHMLFW